MFIAQLLKILFAAAFIYLVFKLVAYILGVRKIVRAKLKEEEKRREAMRQEPSRDGTGKQVIEIDKNHYKVE